MLELRVGFVDFVLVSSTRPGSDFNGCEAHGGPGTKVCQAKQDVNEWKS